MMDGLCSHKYEVKGLSINVITIQIYDLLIRRLAAAACYWS
jgi:hypothetical protein